MQMFVLLEHYFQVMEPYISYLGDALNVEYVLVTVLKVQYRDMKAVIPIRMEKGMF